MPPPVSNVNTAAIQKTAWERIQPSLKSSDEKTRELTNQLIHRIESFFNTRKAGSRAFAEAALSWPSKWELIIKSRKEYHDFIGKRFSEYIFSENELHLLFKEATDEYSQGLKAVENELLVNVRADLQDLPASALPSFANVQGLNQQFNQIVTAVAKDVARDLKIDVGKELGSLAIGEIIAAVVTNTLTAVATRMGISSAIYATGGGSSLVTMGAGIVIAIAVDSLLNWIISWFHNPIGDITDKVSVSLDEVANIVTSGDPDAWLIRTRVAEMARDKSNHELAARSAEVLVRIEHGGALGLKFALGQIAEVQSRSRHLALRQLVFGKESL